jgi:sulfite exporter TauE/SafE/copper chaperone CopZ
MGMENGILTRTLRIDGMTCVNCQNRIARKLRSAAGVEAASASYTAGTATVTYNADAITVQEIVSIIEELDYSVRSSAPLPGGAAGTNRGREQGSRNVGILIIIVSVFVLARNFGFLNLFNAFPLAEAGMGYGMLFLIGLVTSAHCVAMCGGIGLSQTLSPTGSSAGGAGATTGAASSGGIAALRTLAGSGRARAFARPSLLYNAGRLVSYTAVGALVGALGQVISFSGALKGLVQLFAGVFMVIMGINMLGIFPALRRFAIRMPDFFARNMERETEAGAAGRGKGPLYVGLLNGLMPCGPLQAMQLYALSTGSPVKGALSMMLFALGTIPLMFGLGLLSSVLSGAFTKKVMTAGAALVVFLGLSMFANGWSLSGLASPLDMLGSGPGAGTLSTASYPGGGAAAEDGVQIVQSTLSSGRYPAITVEAGIPVKWTINAPPGSINGCNNRMIIREYGIEHRFTPGDNLIEFTPVKAGIFRYSCWMGMIRSSITVLDPAAVAAGDEENNYYDDDDIEEPEFAGFRIPVGEIGVAVIGEEEGRTVQRVTLELTDRGFVPAVVVVEAGVLTGLTFNNVSTRPGNFALRFPDYGQEVPIGAGETVLALAPRDDFDFSTADSEFYGYVKVVDDINAVDIEAVKAEAGGFETMIYPSSWFASGGGGARCH